MRKTPRPGRPIATTAVEPLERRQLLSVTPVAVATLGPLTAAQVAVDAAGNVYGTTLSAGGDAGSVYKIAAGTHVAGTLASFGPTGLANTLGVDPSDIVIDAAGNLFGIANASAGPPYVGDSLKTDTLWELPAGSSTVTLLTHLEFLSLDGPDALPKSVTIDAFDDLFVISYGLKFQDTSPDVQEYVAATGTATTIATSQNV